MCTARIKGRQGQNHCTELHHVGCPSTAVLRIREAIRNEPGSAIEHKGRGGAGAFVAELTRVAYELASFKHQLSRPHLKFAKRCDMAQAPRLVVIASIGRHQCGVGCIQGHGVVKRIEEMVL